MIRQGVMAFAVSDFMASELQVISEVNGVLRHRLMLKTYRRTHVLSNIGP